MTCSQIDEQDLSALHKRNFDLKLELFHRRERQTVLEKRIETLEGAKTFAEEANTRLLQEMEKRDRAVEEAVQMIVSLEQRIELLLREREMVRQLEADKALLARLNHSPSTALFNHDATPKRADELLPNERRDLARMPSFVSEHTENLRSVYLDTKPSYLSLSKADSRADNNGFVSPSMSVLSEDSFLSVYGNRTFGDSSSPPDIPRSIPGRVGGNGQRSISMPIKFGTPSNSRGTEWNGKRDAAKGMVEGGAATSLLPEPEKLDESSPVDHATLRSDPSTVGIERSATAKASNPQPLLRIKNERDRLPRKIIAEEPVSNHHGLPPTPDTVTSSMLNHSQVSDDAGRRDHIADQAKYPVLTRLTLDHTDQVEPGHWRFKSADIAQPPSISAFTGRQDNSPAAYYEHRLPALRRPRSADETTISRHRNDWDSCSDGDDICSEASSFDYWMKEGLRPSHGGVDRPQTRFGPPQTNSGRDSPDLFGFPSNGKGWQSNDKFGSLEGKGYLGIGAPLAPALDALGASLPAPERGQFGSGLGGSSSPRPDSDAVAPPPAPNRRSSLHARTSAPGTPTTTRAPGSSVKQYHFESDRKRSVSGQLTSSSNPNGWPNPSSRGQAPTAPVPPQPQQQDDPTQKRHYPPHASQPQAAARPRSRGITSLFRRSLGSTGITTQPSASVPATRSPFDPPANKDAPPPAVGVPAWERRSDLLHEEASVTPPPIMRQRGSGAATGPSNNDEGRRNTATGAGRAVRATTFTTSGPGLGAGLGRALASQDGGAPLTQMANHNTEQEAASAQPSQPHGRRWFNRLKHGGA